MFFRLLLESFRRQRRRKLLAGAAILLGITAVTTMLALATTIGDRIHQELAVYGANIIVYPKADTLDVTVGGINLKPNTGNAYLKESDLNKLKSIFWANNITGISPELQLSLLISGSNRIVHSQAVGLWFHHQLPASAQTSFTGAPQLHPSWTITGAWPIDELDSVYSPDSPDVFHHQAVLGVQLAQKLAAHVGDVLLIALPMQNDDPPFVPLRMDLRVTGIVSTGEPLDNQILLPLAVAQSIAIRPDAISRIEISARTKPEDAFARQDPDTLSPQQKEIWYCRPYANSIAYQIQEAIPNSHAEQIRKVEQSEGNVLNRISGLMWLIAAAALLAASFAVSAAMATAVLERRAEIGLMRSLGASRPAIALLFYAETAILAIAFGTVGYLTGSALAATLGHRIFPTGTPEPTFNIALLPAVLALALIVAIAGSTPSIRNALRQDPSAILRNGA